MVGKQCLGKDGQVDEAVAYWTMVVWDKVVLLHSAERAVCQEQNGMVNKEKYYAHMHLCLCLCPAQTRPISMGLTSETGQAWLRVVLVDTMLV